MWCAFHRVLVGPHTVHKMLVSFVRIEKNSNCVKYKQQLNYGPAKDLHQRLKPMLSAPIKLSNALHLTQTNAMILLDRVF